MLQFEMRDEALRVGGGSPHLGMRTLNLPSLPNGDASTSWG
jgi:hypothetical protein